TWTVERAPQAACDELPRAAGGPPIALPELITDGSHVYHQYVVRVADHDRIRTELTRRGVGTGVHYLFRGTCSLLLEASAIRWAISPILSEQLSRCSHCPCTRS